MNKKPFTIFVLEDNEWYNKLLVHTLSLNPDFLIKSFSTGKKLLASLSEHPNVITLDYRLPDSNGEELLKKIKAINPEIEVVVVSEQEDVETAITLLKLGAYDYFVKSKGIKESLLNCVNNISKNQSLKSEFKTLKKEVQGKYAFQKTIIGNSPAIQNVLDLIPKALDNKITVNISGETGTGKEVIAKAIHYNSNRKDGPFVAVNMAAIPSELIETELFGHEKGAFTGAATRRIGKFEEANKGTLFLDEISEMDINFQAKLLRALQENEVVRIGGNSIIKTDIRVIVATHKDLVEEVKKGNFREDLFYRIYGLSIELPPLRNRDKDAIILAQYFISAFCKENQIPAKSLSEEAIQKLLSYSWPGNVRELKSVVELATVIANTDTIESANISIGNHNDLLPDVISNKGLTLREYNKKIVELYMKNCNNDTKTVASKLGIGQTTVYRLLKDYPKN